MFFKVLYGSLNLIVSISKKIQKQKMFFGSSFILVLGLLFVCVDGWSQRYGNYTSGAGNLINGGGGLTIENRSTNPGGAVYVLGTQTTLTLSGNITFKNNNASGAVLNEGGGAIFSQGATINFAGNTTQNATLYFFENKSPSTTGESGGGAVFFRNSNVTFQNYANVIFSGNTTGNDGAAMFFHGTTMRVNESVSNFIIKNHTGGFGPGLYVKSGDSSAQSFLVFAAKNVEFLGNTAQGNSINSFTPVGGTMWLQNTSTAAFSGNATGATVLFSGNRAITSAYSAHPLGLGGVIQMQDITTLIFDKETITMKDNSATGRGGAIDMIGNTILSFTNSTTNFIGNNAPFGAAISASGSAQIEFNGGSIHFSGNTSSSTTSQGNIYFSGNARMTLSNLTELTANYNKAASGGVLYLPNLPFDFAGNKMEMIGNEANGTNTGYGYGGVFLINGASAIVKFAGTTMTFTGNKASYGAVLYATNNADITFSGNSRGGYLTFSGNQSFSGNGVISWASGAKVAFKGLDSLIAKWNKAIGGGFLNIDGANYTLGSNLIIITSNTATGTTSTGSGGGIYLTGSNVTFDGKIAEAVSRLEISTNAAGASGGGMYLTGSKATFVMTTMTFSANTAATSGGGMYFQSKSTAEFTSYLMEFKGNKANNGNGGAIYYTASRAIFSPTMMIFSGNTATGSGGGMYFTQSTASFTQASVSKPFLEMTFIGNKSGATGGAMYFQNSTATFAANNLMRFANNQAYTDGGAMYFTVANAIFSKAANMSFEVNYATGSGGAMYFDKARAIFSPTSMTFSDNKANGSGGGMYFVGSTASFVEASTMIFRGNKAGATGLAGRGGAMYFINSSATFAASQVMRFVGNQAYTEGGGMYFNYANAIFSQAKAMSFEVNYATGSGGAMYFDRARANFSPISMTFSDNEAGISGGGMYFTQSTATFAGSTMAFIGNKTNTEKGGAMYFVNSSATFAASEVMRFANNQAKTDGGGMYFTLSNALFSQSKEMKFEVNVASANGGGLAFNNAIVLFSPTSMTFSGNVAGMGGGIYLDGKSSATFSATAQMIFEANRAANGGGMSLANARALFDTRGTMTFRANVATSSGAGMYLSGSTMTFQAETMEFFENKAEYGAVLYVTDGSKVVFTKGAVRFEHNETFSGNGVIAWDNGADVSFTGLKDLVSRYNKAKQGGFLYVEKASYELGADTIEISSNQAVGGVGGAIYLKGSELVFNVDEGRGRLDITTNTANTNGGGLYLEAALGQEGIMSSNLAFNAGTISFSKNVANSSGGAIYLRESTITFAAAGVMEFKGNGAGVGAVLYATSNSWVVFERGAVDIRNNRSEGGRGVISWDEGSQVSFRDLQSLQAKENSSPEGGFIYIEGADYKLGANEIEISSNEARTGSGGAVYLIKSTMSFEATGGAVQIKFLGNRSSQEGGAIYASQGSLITLDTGAGTQGQIVFSGNKANNIANDIYLSNSKIVLIAYEEGEGIRLMGGIKAVEGSTVSMEGAGTLYLSGVTEFEETEFRLGAGNKVIITNDGEFTYNNASKGIEIIGSTMVFEKATVEIRGNKEGGLIAKEGASIIFMKSRKDMIFAANQGTNAGVVIRAVGGSTVAFSNDNTLKIENNGDTQTDSSILYWDETSQINFNGARILGKNNKAQNGVFVKLIEQDWKVNGYQLEMTGGEAGENGGVIYAQRSTVTLNTNARYISFSNNIAGGELNDIYLEDSILRLEATNEEITMNSGIKTQGTFRLIKTGEGNATIGGIVNVEGAGGEWEIKEGRMIVNATPRDNTSGAGLGGLRGAPLIQTKEALVIIGSMTVYEDGIYSMIGKGIVVTSVTNELVIRGGIEIGVESGQGWDMVADRIYASTITIVEGSYLKLKLYGANTASDIIPIMYTQWGINGIENLKPVYDEGFFYSFAYDDDIGTPKEIYVRLEVPLISLENLTHNQREVIRMLNELKELDAITYRLPITRRLALGEGIGALQGLDEMSGEFLANALSMGARENNKVARHAQTNSEQKDMWLEGNINGFEYNKEGNYDGAFEGNEKEIMAGIDVYRTKEGAIGIFIGYGFIDIRQGESSAKIGDTKVGIYGGSFGNNTSFVGSLSGGLQELEIERYVGIKEEKPKSNFNTYSIRFSGEIDYKFILDSQREFYVKPFAGLNGGAVFNERIEEANGKITDLIIESGNYMRLEGNFGIKIELSASKMRYNGRLYGEYLLVGNRSEYEIGIAKIPKYGRMNIWGVEGKQVLGGIGIGAEYEATRNIGIYANTDIKSSLNTFVYFVNGGIKYKFGKATTR